LKPVAACCAAAVQVVWPAYTNMAAVHGSW